VSEDVVELKRAWGFLRGSIRLYIASMLFDRAMKWVPKDWPVRLTLDQALLEYHEAAIAYHRMARAGLHEIRNRRQ